MAAPGKKQLPPGFEQLAKQMFKDVLKANKDQIVQPTFRDAVMGFFHAIDWTEVRPATARVTEAPHVPPASR